MTYPSVEQPSLAQPQPVNWPSADIASPTTAPAYDAPQTMPVVVGQPPATAGTSEKPEDGDQPQYVQPQTVQPQLGGAHVINVPEPVVVDPRHEDDKSCWLPCLQVSCVLSVLLWPIGCFAFCLNLDAQPGSKRHKWARICLTTATICMIIGVTYFAMGGMRFSYSYSSSY
ncbi:unnamed protein product [Vitrella brassicaformis CCMP3155]|uniref:Uncharacterized protein n=1 Tax=Vitrella brassicaformis (strain CCMP3155) TaxID=1169540 RepID=A0A0G4FMJ7_VITBC|nr:unnamed protein product [Vitrella brassicaformis CCMP3155]|eukprot:CEM15062.1 unnamed protein product [Vitrella brassicaformis CCMP3155]